VRVIFGILFAVIFGIGGARFAGWLADFIQIELAKRFEGPEQVDQFRLIAEMSVTVAAALLGVVVGLVVASLVRHRFFRREA